MSNIRKKIFLCPTSPADKDFLGWLGARLSMVGYDVWSELGNLQGGEYVGNNLERIVSDEAAICLFIVNADTKNTRKVMDVIQAALNVEEQMKIDSFVTPLFYTSFNIENESPLSISRKHFIDSCDWNAGLTAVIKKLGSLKIEKDENPSKSTIAWIQAHSKRQNVVKKVPELLQTNWYPIALPEFMHFYEVSGISGMSELPALTSSLSVPAREHLRLLCGFADSDEYNSALPNIYSVSHKYQVKVDDFLFERIDQIACEHHNAKKIISSLVTKSWNKFAKERGLQAFEQADGQIVWWFPKSLVGDNYVSFEKIDKSKGRRQLTGKYHQYNWHFGIKGAPILDEPRRMVFSPHVIFTTDGEKTVEKQYMHSKRRSACKSWRNDKWRELFLAAIEYLCGEDAGLKLPLAANSFVEVSKSPIYIESEVSIDVDALQSDPNTDVEEYEEELEEGAEPVERQDIA